MPVPPGLTRRLAWGFLAVRAGGEYSVGTLAQASQATVTLVDDEAHVRDILARATRSWDYHCQAAATAEDALDLLAKAPTPVVITDLRMPGRGGVWLTREIQRRWPGTAIIVVTAGQDADAQAQCLAAGASHYLLKPIQFDELRHALAATFRSFEQQQVRECRRLQLEEELHLVRAEKRQTFVSAIASLVRTLEARDPYTSGHSYRVRNYVMRLAKWLNLGNGSPKKLSLAAKLHDIGKVGLPEAILQKSSGLSIEEFALVREHPAIGERILRPVVRSRAVLAAIRHHHERYDGQGYPDGLRGERIPFLARLIAVADCFDAMTSARSYREKLSVGAALELVRQEAGRQFDPHLALAFVAMVTETKSAEPEA